MIVSATCTRVPVIDGHLVNISVELEEAPDYETVIRDWNGLSRARILCPRCRARPAARYSIWSKLIARSPDATATPAKAW